MNPIRDKKLTRIVSTKITDEEHNLLHRLARNYKSRGYIAKATTAEISRLIVRVYMEWAFSHSCDEQTAMTHTMSQNNEKKSTHSTVTMLGSNAANKRGGSANAASLWPTQSSSIPINNTLSMGNAQQSSDFLCKILSTYYYDDDYYYLI
jgi:hypothetical protein